MGNTLGKRIMVARKELGITQEQLADQLGVTAQAVSKWENDQSCPDISILPKIADLFHTTTDNLLGHTPQPSTPPPPSEQNHPQASANRNGNWKTICFALIVLLCGVMMVTNILLSLNISIWDILWPCGLLLLGVCGISSGLSFLRLGCILFGCYFLLENLNIIDLNLGTEIVLPIIIVLLGLSLLIQTLCSTKRRYSSELQIEHTGFAFSGSFGETEQIISLDVLQHGKIRTRFGQYTIDLSGVKSISTNCQLQTDCRFGHLTLVVPSCYEVCCDNHTSFANVDTIGEPKNITGRIMMRTKVSFGQIEVRYI